MKTEIEQSELSQLQMTDCKMKNGLELIAEERTRQHEFERIDTEEVVKKAASIVYAFFKDRKVLSSRYFCKEWIKLLRYSRKVESRKMR